MSIHPLGQVPALRTDAYLMFESVAIVLQLLDEHPQVGLAPPFGSPARATYYQWSVFACAQLDPVLLDVMKHTMHLPDDQRVPAIAHRAADWFHERAAMLNAALSQQPYLLGTDFSGADIVVGYSCNWAAYTGLLDRHPQLVEYYARLQRRPAFARVFDTD